MDGFQVLQKMAPVFLLPSLPPSHSLSTVRGLSPAAQTSANAWHSWRSRNWSSTSWSRAGQRRSARSWRAQVDPRTLVARQHLQRDPCHCDIPACFTITFCVILDELGTLLRVFSDSHFGRGTHGVDASVSVTGVGALIRRLHTVQDQAAVRRHQDVTTVRTHRDAVSVATEGRVKIKVDESGEVRKSLQVNLSTSAEITDTFQKS